MFISYEFFLIILIKPVLLNTWMLIMTAAFLEVPLASILQYMYLLYICYYHRTVKTLLSPILSVTVSMWYDRGSGLVAAIFASC